MYLDLGNVQVMAEPKLNGKSLGILWRAPFRVDITDAVKAGENALEVKVVNLWINRMIGDEFLPDDSDRNPDGTLKAWPKWVSEGKPSPTGRYTFTSWRLWHKDDSLRPSGMLGPGPDCFRRDRHIARDGFSGKIVATILRRNKQSMSGGRIFFAVCLWLGTAIVSATCVAQSDSTSLEQRFHNLPMESRRLTGPLFWLHGDETPERLEMYVGKVPEGGNGCFTTESRPHNDWLGRSGGATWQSA